MASELILYYYYYYYYYIIIINIIALGVIGGLGYHIYRSKKGEQPQQNNPKPYPQMQPQTNKSEMD